MFLDIDSIRSLGGMLLLFKSKTFIAAEVAVERFLLSHSRERLLYTVSYIFFMYRTSELKNIFIFIKFSIVIQNVLQNQAKCLVRISKTTPSGISLHVSKEAGLYLRQSQVD
jgi:hypothetical protein